MTNKLSRRQFLAAAGSIAGTVALAACVPVAQTTAPASDTANEGVAVTTDGLVEIEYWHRQSGDTALLLETLAGEFNAANEGEVQVTPIAQGSI